MRARLINENIGDILVPKTDEEIKKSMRRFSGDELWDMWLDTGRKEYLQYAAKKRINNVNAEDLAEALNSDPDLAEVLFPHIIKHFPLLLDAKNNNFFITIDWWGDLAFLFNETRDLNVETIEQILGGEDTYDLFERTDNVDLDDAASYVAEMEKDYEFFKEITEELREKMIEECEDDSIIEEINVSQKLSDLIQIIANNDGDFYNTRDAVELAVNETQTIADESEALSELKKAIQNEFDWKDLNNYFDKNSNTYKIPVSKPIIITIFKMAHDIIDKITYYPPQYGWSGDIDDHPEVFRDSLSNRLSDI